MGSNGIKSMKMHRTVLLTTDAVLTKLTPLDHSMCFLRLCLQSTAPPGSHLGFSDPPNSSQLQCVSLGGEVGKLHQFVHKLKRSPFLSLSESQVKLAFHILDFPPDSLSF